MILCSSCSVTGGKDMDDAEMSIVDHLTELRTRIIISAASIIVFSIFGYIFSDQILSFLTRPVGSLVFISPAEAFFTHLKVAVFSGFFIALPIVLFQFWRFLLPALKKNEKKFMVILLPSSLFLFLIGAAFCLMVVVPIGIRFFMGFESPELAAMLSLSSYISFLISLVIPFGIIFELPLVISMLVRLRILTPDQISRFRKVVIVVIFVIGAILTPPDIFSQVMMALPLILLFEGSLIIARIIAPKD